MDNMDIRHQIGGFIEPSIWITRWDTYRDVYHLQSCYKWVDEISVRAPSSITLTVCSFQSPFTNLCPSWLVTKFLHLFYYEYRLVKSTKNCMISFFNFSVIHMIDPLYNFQAEAATTKHIDKNLLKYSANLNISIISETEDVSQESISLLKDNAQHHRTWEPYISETEDVSQEPISKSWYCGQKNICLNIKRHNSYLLLPMYSSTPMSHHKSKGCWNIHPGTPSPIEQRPHCFWLWSKGGPHRHSSKT